ncbi:hypothetical protein [Gilliamella sp. BG7]|uniref:hypothetical protein n=1 Tax=unclassified Gilliamella TaxID=2685620 RepID=UPI00398708B5
MLEKHKSYSVFKEFNRKMLTPVSNDINTYSNMKLAIQKSGKAGKRGFKYCTS